MPDPIPTTVPLKLTPNDFRFEACIANPPLTQARTFRLTMRGPGRMILRRFRLVGSGAGRFTLSGPGAITLTNGESTTFSVMFDPEKVRTYEARVVFSIIHHRGDGSSLLVWGRVPLVGLGKDCAAEKPGDPPPPEVVDENAGEGDGPDADGGGATPPGGGSEPGTDPPANANPVVSEVCVRFWKLPGAADTLGDTEFNSWLREVNEIFRNSGVQFRRGEGPVETVAEPGAKADDHCLDIYVGGPDLIPGDTAAATRVSQPDDAAAVLRDVKGVHGGFLADGGWIGERIQMESGNAANSTPESKTLAHELGHALGLGPAVERPDGNQDHLDPDDGQPITNEERLMHPGSLGTKLTELERRIAARMARIIEGGPRCRKTTEYRYEPDDRSQPLDTVRFRNRNDIVEVVAGSRTGFPLAAPHRLALELSVHDALEAWSSVIEYEWNGKSWRYSAEPARTEEAPALRAPTWLELFDMPVEPGTPRLAYGLRVEVPKDYFGIAQRVVGFRLRAGLAGAEMLALPRGSGVKLDLTLPVYTVELSEASRAVTAARGGMLTLKGTGWQSETFTGQAGLSLWLRALGVSRIIDVEPLPKPVPETGASRCRCRTTCLSASIGCI